MNPVGRLPAKYAGLHLGVTRYDRTWLDLPVVSQTHEWEIMRIHGFLCSDSVFQLEAVFGTALMHIVGDSSLRLRYLF